MVQVYNHSGHHIRDLLGHNESVDAIFVRANLVYSGAQLMSLTPTSLNSPLFPQAATTARCESLTPALRKLMWQ